MAMARKADLSGLPDDVMFAGIGTVEAMGRYRAGAKTAGKKK